MQATYPAVVGSGDKPHTARFMSLKPVRTACMLEYKPAVLPQTVPIRKTWGGVCIQMSQIVETSFLQPSEDFLGRIQKLKVRLAPCRKFREFVFQCKGLSTRAAAQHLVALSAAKPWLSHVEF